MTITSLWALPQVKYMISLIHDQPSISLAYSVLILLVTSYFTFAVWLSLLCHFYFRCHHHFHITVATNISLPSKYLSGAVELTTQLLILNNILWLPLCRINKFGLNTLPSKVVAIPYTCGLSLPLLDLVAADLDQEIEATDVEDRRCCWLGEGWRLSGVRGSTTSRP